MNTTSSGEKVTLNDIAHAAGVSKATASKALNGRKDVSQATRERVLAACEELGYSRRHAAPSPTAGPGSQRPTIALVADNLETTYSLEVLKGASTAAMRLGADLLLFHSSFSEDERPDPEPLTRAWVDLIASRGAVGVITLTSPSSAELDRRLCTARLSHVAIDPASPPAPGSESIGATNWNGGVEATRHLLALGHSRIAYIDGPENSVPNHERREGYISALRMAGVEYRPDLVDGGAFSYENGRDAGRRLLGRSSDERPTAIFAANDVNAIGVYEAARQLGIRIPYDLSVIGFDDTDLARWATPRLTTVHQPLLEMGARAVSAILSTTNGDRALGAGPIELRTRLVVRDSTARAPKD